ncbi:MAG: molecular chaperone DnaK [Gammaproteobacteria bacterium HGW-Gammaproteobacteria-7]|nr:MAG: molecular chaperone DnaK [Gammaproteobacteria bacterium HGW-Gammaproteobacteria-7]
MLTQADRQYFLVRVDATLNDVRRALEMAAANDSGTVILDQSSVGRLSRMDALQQQAMAAGWKETLLREQRRLEAARVRLDEGAFGACCQCGEPIPRDRLEADLGTPFCADCQAEIEAGQSGRKR